jgi:hypothetical protein
MPALTRREPSLRKAMQMSFAIPGTVVDGFGGATNSIELQKLELRKYFPKIDECRSGTINVYLHAPLDVRIPDIVTRPIAWQPGHPERFGLTKAEMRDTGVRGILIYCSDYKCSHSISISGD